MASYAARQAAALIEADRHDAELAAADARQLHWYSCPSSNLDADDLADAAWYASLSPAERAKNDAAVAAMILAWDLACAAELAAQPEAPF